MTKLRKFLPALRMSRPTPVGASRWFSPWAAIALAAACGPAAAIEFGSLRLYLPPGQPAYAEITLTDSNPLDPADIRARVATPDAYSVANMRYVPALQGIVLTPQAGANGQVVLRVERLPAPGDVPEIDLLLLVGDRMSLALGEYRVNLRGTAREFAAAPPGSRLGGPSVPPAPATPVPAPQVATASPVTGSAPVVVDNLPAAPNAPRAPVAQAAVAADPSLAEAEAALQAWIQAWSRKDVDAYIAAYTPDYAGRVRGGSRDSWMAQRRSRILSKQKITVEISKPRLTLRDGAVEATFSQSYRGDGLTERSRKRVVLVKVDKRWLIQDEEEL